jgi:hypothetical protein
MTSQRTILVAQTARQVVGVLTQRTVLKNTYILMYVLYKNFIMKVCILRYWQRHIFR